jgi:hypothetical protein
MIGTPARRQREARPGTNERPFGTSGEWHASAVGRVAVGLIVVVLSVGGCNSSPKSECLSESGAEVCLRIDGGVQINGEGLEPGSELTVKVLDGPTQVVEVDDTGSTGTVGFLTAVVPDSAAVEISGTASGGEAVTGSLSVG